MKFLHSLLRSLLVALPLLAILLLTQCETPGGGGSGGGSLAQVTTEKPFVNSLGMKFVPIPGTKILMCTTETTVDQYKTAGMIYNAPWYPQQGDHPAVNVQWAEAKSWCAWLSKKEGRRYRLPTEQEWNAATGPYRNTWGDDWPPAYRAGNFAGQEWRTAPAAELQQLKDLWKTKVGGQWSLIKGYQDSYLYTAPVGSQTPDGLGLQHLSGNVWEWCESQVLKGGSWVDAEPAVLQSSYVASRPLYDFDNGFRCVLVK